MRRPASSSFLQHPILGTNVPMAEVQAYTEARVPLMPVVKSAVEWQKIADRLRREMFERVVFRGEAMAWRDAKTKVEWFDTIDGGPRLQNPEAALRGAARAVDSGTALSAGQPSGESARDARRQRPRCLWQGRALQTDSLHQSRQARHHLAQCRVARHGPTARARLHTHAHEPTRPLRHQRRVAVLSGNETRAGCAAVPGASRPRPSGGLRPLRRRLANHLHQFARHTRDPCPIRSRVIPASARAPAISPTSAIRSKRRATWQPLRITHT